MLQIYPGYKKNIDKKYCQFQKDLQTCCRLFFHRSYIIYFIYQECSYKNEKFNFPAKIYKIRKICWEKKWFILERFITLVLTIFCRSYIFLLFIKNVFVKMKNWFFPPKYTRYGKNIRKKIVYFKKIHNFGTNQISKKLYLLFIIEKYYFFHRKISNSLNLNY